MKCKICGINLIACKELNVMVCSKCEDDIGLIEASIIRWNAFAMGWTSLEIFFEEDCPLCTVYIFPKCHGCPIMNKTRLNSCNGTPLDQWSRDTYWDQVTGKSWVADWTSTEDEIEFLVSLLPKDHKWRNI